MRESRANVGVKVCIGLGGVLLWTLVSVAVSRGEITSFKATYDAELTFERGSNPSASSGSEKGTVLISVPEKRALVDFTPSNAGLRRQDVFDRDTYISVSVRGDTSNLIGPRTSIGSGPKPKITVIGKPKQSHLHWLDFVTTPPACVAGIVLQKLRVGKDVVDLSLLPSDERDSKDAKTFKYTITREPSAGNSIVKFHADLASTPKGDQPAPTIVSCDLTVNEFRRYGDEFVPIDFTHSITHGTWVPVAPPNAFKPNAYSPVPPTVYKTRFRLSDIIVNGSVDANAFRAMAEDGHPAVNLDARHIGHVLVSNKILPEVNPKTKELLRSIKKPEDGISSQWSRFRSQFLYWGCVAFIACVTTFGIFKLWSRKTLLLLAFGCWFSAASQTFSVASEGEGPFCGVYAMLAVFKVLEVDCEPEVVLAPKYIGSHRGSSAKELASLANDFNLQCVVSSGLNMQHLRFSTVPMVLHMRPDSTTDSYQHWVAFLGTENGLPILFDSPGKCGPVTWTELLHRWDGVGLMISSKPISWFSLCIPQLIILIQIAAMISIALIALLIFQTPFLKRSATIGFCMHFALAFVLFAIHHVAFGLDLTSESKVVMSMQKRFFIDFSKEVDFTEFKRIVASENCFLVDARFPKDFELASISGATNIPPNSSVDYRNSVCEKRSKMVPVIVFCQSKHCPFADSVADDLSIRGFESVRVFRPGYHGWLESKARGR